MIPPLRLRDLPRAVLRTEPLVVLALALAAALVLLAGALAVGAGEDAAKAERLERELRARAPGGRR